MGDVWYLCEWGEGNPPQSSGKGSTGVGHGPGDQHSQNESGQSGRCVALTDVGAENLTKNISWGLVKDF